MFDLLIVHIGGSNDVAVGNIEVLPEL